MIDLHVHLDGSLTPEDVLLLATESAVTLPTTDLEQLRNLLTVEEDCKSLSEYLERFDLPLLVLQTAAAVEKSVCFMLKRLHSQGLIYAEVRFAPQLHRANGLSQEEVVTAAVKGLNQAVEETGMPAQLILCCMRTPGPQDVNRETVEVAKKFLGKGVCAVDLAGDEAGNPTRNYQKLFDYAHELGVPVILHAGESAGSFSVSDALDMGALRIGHGTLAAECEEVMARLKAGSIPLEVCYTSNLQTKAAKTLPCHPVRLFFDRGLAVTIHTDNMSVSDTVLKREYRRLMAEFGFTLGEMKQIALNAVKASFTDEDMKKTLAEKIERNFQSWLE